MKTTAAIRILQQSMRLELHHHEHDSKKSYGHPWTSNPFAPDETLDSGTTVTTVDDTVGEASSDTAGAAAAVSEEQEKAEDTTGIVTEGTEEASEGIEETADEGEDM